MELRPYHDTEGRSPFERWYDDLDRVAAVRIGSALERLAEGNTSNVRSVGQGVSEYRIHFGPGYRIYFAVDSPRLIILLGGGTKQRQRRDIQTAQQHWQDYRREKRVED
ncbi:MAG: type II toxin-antitoxin system RelE/ParE family toxin [Chloroflexi bacterium]|nr:type II toxin-antitoxin system RelE/ParE family toxin [Chloroflexota bacterium]